MAEPSQDLREQANKLGITLPPLGPHPKRWWRSFQLPDGPALVLPSGRTALLKTLFWDMRHAAVLAVVSTMIAAGASALIPWALGVTIDTATTSGFGASFGWSVLVFIAMTLLVAIGDGLGEVADNQVWMQSEFQARRSVIAQLTSRPRAMKRHATSGDVLTAAMDDGEMIGSFFEVLTSMSGAVVAVILVTYLMLSASVSLGLTVMIGMPIALGLIALVAKPLERRHAAVREAQGQLTTIATDAVQGLRILRGVGGEAAYAKAFEDQSEVVRKASIKAAASMALLESASAGAPMLLIAVVVAQGAFLAYHGEITPGQLVSFFGYTFYLRLTLWNATRLVERLTRARVGAARIGELNTITPLVTGGSSTQAVDWARVALTITPHGHGITLTPGKITGLVTPSPQEGAALARAFAWVEDPCVVTINETPLGNWPVETIRQAVVLSEATPQVFAGTLREALLGHDAPLPVAMGVREVIDRQTFQMAITQPRIRAAHPDLDETILTLGTKGNPGQDHLLLEAIALAHAQDVVESVAGGLDGRLDEKGRNLSGGQRQRLALARAYVTKAPILILVEPTSALDAHTESLIGSSLQAARSGQTTLVSTHSPLILAHCDEVIVTDTHGQVLGRGRYEDLHRAGLLNPSREG